MGVRTAGLVAGVIGVFALAAGLVADSQRPPQEVTASANLDTAVVVYEPAMLAFAGDSRIGVSGTGEVAALTARPVDAEAWLETRTVTVVTGLPEWETLSTRTDEYVEPEPTASPEATPSPTPAPSPAAEDDEASDDAVDVLTAGSFDHWREQWDGVDRVAVRASDVPPGEVLVVASRDGSPLTGTDIGLERDVNDGWITPLIWWGVVLTAVGLVALVLRFFDLRPLQARGEEWMASRQRVGAPTGVPTPGGRRARRSSGAGLPDASLDGVDAPPSRSDRSDDVIGQDDADEPNGGRS